MMTRSPHALSWPERLATLAPFLACLLCPVCLSAILGAFSAAGVGFLIGAETHSFLIGASLVISMASIGWSAGRRRRIGPLLCGVTGALVLLAGHASETLVVELFGLAGLLLGSAVNLRTPRSPRPMPNRVEQP